MEINETWKPIRKDVVLSTYEVQSCGRSLLLNFTLELLKRYSCVIIACLERPQQFFKSWLPPDVLHKIKWVESTSYLPSEKSDIFSNISSIVGKLDQQTGVIIDSLSIPIFLNDTPSVCQAFHKLKGANNVCQLIALLHKDIHDESTLRLVKHQASSVLDLSPGPQGMQACHIRHCRPTGKVLKTAEAFRMDEKFYIQNIQPLNKIDGSKNKQNIEEQGDPISQLTFNLSLTNSEKEARSQVVLPYLKDRSKDEPVSQGRIYYQADELDDLDEEDPDDDLNI